MNYKIAQLIFVCSIAFFNGGLSQDYWQEINSPTMNKLRKLSFTDSLSGWAAGNLGTIIHTEDGGNSWEFQNSGVSTNLVDIFFLNDSLGWALTWNLSSPAGTVILNTTDGGETWLSENYPETNMYMNRIFFQDSLRGWMGGSPGAFVYTTDGGMQWNDVIIDSGSLGSLPVSSLSFYDSNFGFASGGVFDIAGVIWKTTNGGINWTAVGVGPEPVEQIVVVDSLIAVGVGGDFEFGTSVVRTSDAGETWDYKIIDFFGIALALAFRTPAEGWATLGSVRRWIITNDSGKTWTVVPSPANSSIFDLTFTDSLHGYAVGDTGRIFKFDPTMVGIEDKVFNLPFPQDYQLLQNYPNPFNPTTTISFYIRRSGMVQISIYDLAGREIAKLINTNLPAGKYKVMWDGSEHPSGIYFCRLRVGNPLTGSGQSHIETKKMILLK